MKMDLGEVGRCCSFSNMSISSVGFPLAAAKERCLKVMSVNHRSSSALRPSTLGWAVGMSLTREHFLVYVYP